MRLCDWVTYLVSHDGLLDSSEVLERGKEDMAPLRTAYIFNEASKLLTKSYENLILVLDRLCGAVRALMLETRGIEKGSLPSKKGMSSSRVRSAPSASAMVESR